MQTEDDCRNVIAKLRALKSDMHGKDYLRTWELSQTNILAMIYTAQILHWLRDHNYDCRVFKSGLAVSNFRDQSTRTRFSWASASSMLGLTPQDLDETKSQVAHGETVRETANMISFLTEAIGIRDDIFINEGCKYMDSVAQAVQTGAAENVLPQRPAVVNLQCDRDHPTQSMADLLHFIQYFGGIENLRGKKIAVTWAYSPSYGKPLSVPQSLIALLPRFGVNVTLAHPPGYNLLPEVVDTAKKIAQENGATFTQVDSMAEAFKDADIVYPKSWGSFQTMEKRSALLKQGQAGKEEMKKLEEACLAENKKFIDWECTEELMKLTKNGKALYCHCLPADISTVSCTRGEVDAKVFDKYRSLTYMEAGHKPFVIAAAILQARFKDVPAILEKLVTRHTPLRMTTLPVSRSSSLFKQLFSKIMPDSSKGCHCACTGESKKQDCCCKKVACAVTGVTLLSVAAGAAIYFLRHKK